MTTKQHLDAARRASEIARIRHAQAVSDHPFDNDQAECADSAIIWFTVATHHALLAQKCPPCDGYGWVVPRGRCQACNGEGWIARGT